MTGFDKIGKETGPGEGRFLSSKKESQSKVKFEYILFNYNIDGNVLKNEHKRLLDKNIIPFVKEHRVHIKLTGMASQSGDRKYNEDLSAGRVVRVKQYLQSKGIPESKIPGPDVRAAGEDLSTSDSSEDPMDRAVLMTIAVGIKPRPVIEEKPTQTVPETVITDQGPMPIVVPIIITDRAPTPVVPPAVSSGRSKESWAIRQLFGFNTNAGFGINFNFGYGSGSFGGAAGPSQTSFLLMNTTTNKVCTCTFAGGALTGGVGVGPSIKKPKKPGFTVGPSIGLTMTGESKEWNPFETPAGVDFADFEGTAGWHEMGGNVFIDGTSAKARLNFHNLGKSVPVTTGQTIGSGASAGTTNSFGYFSCGRPVQNRRPR